MTIGIVSATLTAENTFTDSIEAHGLFNLSFSGLADTTKITLQRSYDGGTLWKDLDWWDADDDDESMGYEVESGVLHRLGIKTGDYDSGTVLARISF